MHARKERTVSPRFVRRIAIAATGIALLVASLATTVSVGAALPNAAFTSVGCDIGNYTCYYNKVGYRTYGYNPYVYASYPYVNTAYRPFVGSYVYQDNRFCDDGRILFSGGQYFCASTGLPVYNANYVRSTGFTPYAYRYVYYR